MRQLELSDEIQLRLAPEEDTEGLITMRVSKFYTIDGHEKELAVTDRITGRVARVKVPGHYPQGRSG